jgi:hypothetical protein
MYTKILFGKELKARVAQEQKASTIGGWAYNVYYGKLEDDEDGEFSDILLILGCMENGEEFEISYERLNEIADDLIAGKKNINMDY